MPIHMDYTITRDQFEDITKALLMRCKAPIQDALRGVPENPLNLSMRDIDDVLLVGGSTRMPAVQKLVRELYGREACATVNPDEVVASGAAIQGGVMNNECTGIVLSDVNSMSVGIKLADDTVNVMIPANTPIPCEESDNYTNAAAHQKNVEIIIVQGTDSQNAYSDKNKILGTAVLSGLPDSTAPQQLDIEITLNYDVDGIIHVSARENSTGVSIETTIEGSSKLSDREVKALAAAEVNQKMLGAR